MFRILTARRVTLVDEPRWDRVADTCIWVSQVTFDSLSQYLLLMQGLSSILSLTNFQRSHLLALRSLVGTLGQCAASVLHRTLNLFILALVRGLFLVLEEPGWHSIRTLPRRVFTAYWLVILPNYES